MGHTTSGKAGRAPMGATRTATGREENNKHVTGATRANDNRATRGGQYPGSPMGERRADQASDTRTGDRTMGKNKGNKGTVAAGPEATAQDQAPLVLAFTADKKARFDALFVNRHYTKTTEQELWSTILNAGLKAIEKRRKGTQEAKIEKAEAILRAAGKL